MDELRERGGGRRGCLLAPCSAVGVGPGRKPGPRTEGRGRSLGSPTAQPRGRHGPRRASRSSRRSARLRRGARRARPAGVRRRCGAADGPRARSLARGRCGPVGPVCAADREYPLAGVDGPRARPPNTGGHRPGPGHQTERHRRESRAFCLVFCNMKVGGRRGVRGGRDSGPGSRCMGRLQVCPVI